MDTNFKVKDIVWKTLPLHDMSGHEVFALLKLRSEVFVVEQQCIYLDADEKDADSLHLFGMQNNMIVACARLVPPGLSYTGAASIGRVCNAKTLRGSGIGKLLMTKAIAETKAAFGKDIPIKISAQQYLLQFYNDLGFEAFGEGYLEDDIPHIAMLLKNSVKTPQ